MVVTELSAQQQQQRPYLTISRSTDRCVSTLPPLAIPRHATAACEHRYTTSIVTIQYGHWRVCTDALSLPATLDRPNPGGPLCWDDYFGEGICPAVHGHLPWPVNSCACSSKFQIYWNWPLRLGHPDRGRYSNRSFRTEFETSIETFPRKCKLRSCCEICSNDPIQDQCQLLNADGSVQWTGRHGNWRWPTTNRIASRVISWPFRG